MSATRPTIKDVAHAAGVSPTTVSLVLNQKSSSISDLTRQRVLDAVKSLHYRPNQLAVSLVTSTTNTIGLILPDTTNPFFASLSHQIETLLRQHNLNVIIGNTSGDPKITREYLRIFYDRQVDGIILAQLDFEDPAETAKCQALLEDIHIPVVYVDRTLQSGEDVSISVDQYQIGYMATNHLLNLGHKKIGCISGPMQLNVNQQRYAGYCGALKDHGLEPDTALLYSESLSIECGFHALPYLLGHNVTGIFSFNDMIAYGVYQACRNYSISIPDDLSVVGVDDIEFSDIIAPPLTTVAQPILQISHLAVDGMLNILQDRISFEHHVLLSPALKVRGSTKPNTKR